MSSNTHKDRSPSLSGNQEEVTYKFRFQINGSSDPDNLIGCVGLIKDIVNVSPGLFDIFFSNFYPTLITCLVESDDSVGDMRGKFVSYTAATGVLRVTTVDEGQAATDPTDDSYVHVNVALGRRTDLNKEVTI